MALAGEIDLQAAPEVRIALAEAMAAPRLRVELGRVTFLDSTGVHAFLSP